MKKETPLQTITLPNGKEALNLVPEHQGKLAIVDLGTIQRLAKSLVKSPFRELKEELITAIDNTQSLEDMCNVMAEELAFH